MESIGVINIPNSNVNFLLNFDNLGDGNSDCEIGSTFKITLFNNIDCNNVPYPSLAPGSQRRIRTNSYFNHQRYNQVNAIVITSIKLCVP